MEGAAHESAESRVRQPPDFNQHIILTKLSQLLNFEHAVDRRYSGAVGQPERLNIRDDFKQNDIVLLQIALNRYHLRVSPSATSSAPRHSARLSGGRPGGRA